VCVCVCVCACVCVCVCVLCVHLCVQARASVAAGKIEGQPRDMKNGQALHGHGTTRGSSLPLSLSPSLPLSLSVPVVELLPTPEQVMVLAPHLKFAC